MNKIPRIAVVGSLNMDIVVEADRPPQMGETVPGNRVHFIPGGKGANQAVACARLGAQTVMIGSVGKDAFGQQLLTALQNDGIVTQTIKQVEDASTGIASILLSQGDNSIVVVAGANAHCLPEDLDQQRSSIEQADAILLQLEVPLPTVLYAAKQAKQLGKQVILNPAPAQDLPAELLANVDVLIPNEYELALLAGVEVTDETSLRKAMQLLLDKGVGIVITTLGADGAAYLTDDGTFGRVTGYQVDVVDTTGAGDSFNAGVAVSLAKGSSVQDAIRYASMVGALAVTKLGAQQGMPTADEVEQFSRQRGELA
ncbi:ribokinase [Brevibacillus fulvus]|uniref:Ribokinase n=1 Tax=Brevibacillus fulvus TaxID=1125967 RepID=A0A939BQV9_9BACL|nr:ribokinase [Brevibacillus fulvus]MBM7588813.1 ribokinase [Brevibacillus fulvus]